MTNFSENTNAPVVGHKPRLSKSQRLVRMIGSFLDPRAYLHGFRVLNYYNNQHVKPRRLVQIGENPSISPTVTFAHGEFIELGANVHLNAGCALWAGPTRGRIIIGNDTLFGPDVFVITSNYRFNDGAPVNNQAMDETDVVIGKDVWIGAKAVILPGSNIGDGAIIGTGAIVRGRIPPFAIATGNPAEIVGQRNDPTGQVDPAVLAKETNLTVQAIIRREHPELTEADMSGLVGNSGLDSFDLVTLRSAIEVGTGVQISDRDWASTDRMEQIPRLQSLAGAVSASEADLANASDHRADATTLPEVGITTNSKSTVTETGHLRRQLSLNMPQMALSGLSEAWLFKELGDIHWAMITAFIKTSSASIADEQGDRLYATFTRLLLEVEPSLRGFHENSEMDFTSSLSRYGPSFYWGDHKLTAGGANVRATTMSTFAKYGERGKNTSLVKGTPTLTQPDAIPQLDAFPDFGVEYRNRRATESEGAIFECDYDILPPHDINGVGLLYFAAYPTIFDLCLEKSEGTGFLMNHSTVSKDICYFANSEPDETLRFRLHTREDDGDLVRHVASLYRESDGKRMAEVISTKRKL